MIDVEEYAVTDTAGESVVLRVQMAWDVLMPVDSTPLIPTEMDVDIVNEVTFHCHILDLNNNKYLYKYKT